MQTAFELPAPGPAAIEHSGRLAALIAARIDAAGGWIDFSEFMDLALYAPGLGYYSAGAAKFGPAGDFVTAPEISPLFGRCMARACAPVLDATGGVVLELGGGTGKLAAELLAALAGLGAAPAQYLMLEPSADLRERQRETLARLAPAQLPRVVWLDRLPAGIEGVVLANEVADALPVSRFVMQGGAPWALGVSRRDDGFCWEPAAASANLVAAVSALQAELPAPLPDGYATEVSLRLPAWLASLGDTLRRGMLLLSDYGMTRREYYHAQRSAGTLICHYRHRAHADPFFQPGLQDITAWVDFSAVAHAADAAGFTIGGYATQAHFLLASGIVEDLVSQPSPAAASAAKSLLFPGEMGERFKVMALTRGSAIPLPGFSIRDLRHRL
jgi:SAM-dependent MidA family methyltransferase